MKFALDATHSLDRNPSGVAVYSRRLIEELTAAAPNDRFLLAYRSNRLLRAFARPLPAPSCSRRLLEEPFSRLWSRGVDLFHGLNQRLPATPFTRTVTTFHDLFVMTADYSTAEYRARFTALARDAAARSDHILTVSAFTADQVADLLAYPRERITVAPHGVDPPLQADAAERATFLSRHGFRPPLILHVGALQKRKNIVRLVEAFETLEGSPTLLLAGAAGYDAAAIEERIRRSRARDRIRVLGYVDAETRRLLYQTAAMLAFPSLAEGFGLPVLEAMAVGLPVVTSNSSALPEAAGDAALLIDPGRTEDLRHALSRILGDTELAADLSRRGKRRAAEHTWQRSARRTLDVYRRLISAA